MRFRSPVCRPILAWMCALRGTTATSNWRWLGRIFWTIGIPNSGLRRSRGAFTAKRLFGGRRPQVGVLMMRSLAKSDALTTSKWLGPVLLLVFGWLVMLPYAAPAADPPTEYQVKAALLLNFARFIDWPAGTFPSSSRPSRLAYWAKIPLDPCWRRRFRMRQRTGGGSWLNALIRWRICGIARCCLFPDPSGEGWARSSSISMMRRSSL